MPGKDTRRGSEARRLGSAQLRPRCGLAAAGLLRAHASGPDSCRTHRQAGAPPRGSTPFHPALGRTPSRRTPWGQLTSNEENPPKKATTTKLFSLTQGSGRCWTHIKSWPAPGTERPARVRVPGPGAPTETLVRPCGSFCRLTGDLASVLRDICPPLPQRYPYENQTQLLTSSCQHQTQKPPDHPVRGHRISAVTQGCAQCFKFGCRLAQESSSQT